MESFINIFLSLIGIYLLIGFLFSIIFINKGLSKIDSGTTGSGWFFKVLIFPGMCIFWVIFLKKWTKERSKH